MNTEQIAFLRARCDERDTMARQLQGKHGPDRPFAVVTVVSTDEYWTRNESGAVLTDTTASTGRHSLFRPQDVLDDVTATRLVIDQCEQVGRYADPSSDAVRLAAGVLHALATAHREHIGYRPEWSTL